MSTTAPFVKGSDTSEAAAVSVESDLAKREAQVLAYVLTTAPQGATCKEVEEALGLSHETASARMRGLVLKGLVRDSGERRKTPSGREAAVYIPGADDLAREGKATTKRPSRPSKRELGEAVSELGTLAAFAKQHGFTPTENLRKLWRWLDWLAKKG